MILILIYNNKYKPIMSFFRKLFRFKQQKDISELTDFLANNEAFKNAAKTVHDKTKDVQGGFGMFSKLD